MKKDYIHEIVFVEPESIAEELGLEPGDSIVNINGHEIEDIFDYQYYLTDDYLEVLVRTRDGEDCLLEIEKEEDEDLGIVFKESLMDTYHSCSNKCIFCFIDQMPPGMRESLYFKDDDSRLSFLQGNYITLTNMDRHDMDRIIAYRLSPINISVHTTNPELRMKMLHNRFAGDIMDRLHYFADAEIVMNSQVVLCKGYNDGEELDRTIRDLETLIPYMNSISVVPVGLTKFRDGLEQLESFSAEESEQVLRQIETWQDYFTEKYRMKFVHASDEWFLAAGRELPPADYYEGYGQIEDGVGMLRLLYDEVTNRLGTVNSNDQDNYQDGSEKARKVTIATGKLAFPVIKDLTDQVMKQYPNIHIQVIPIVNHYFGETITVSGLLTGQDIIDQLKDVDLGDELLLPSNLLKADEEILLDDVSLSDLSESLHVRVNVIQSDGIDFVEKIVNL